MVEAVVEFDYQATEEDELNLVKGDVITNITKMDGGWWEGTLKGKTGMFPDNFVKELPKKEKSKDLSSSIKRGAGASAGAGGSHVAELANKLGKEGLKVGAGPTKRQDSKPQGATIENPPAPAGIPHRVRVAHSYTPKNEDELELIVGQVINITKKEEEGWWEGTTSDGRTGVFPSNFVEEAKEDEDADGEFHAIQGKKVKGIGFGNIFAGGPVKLKGAKKQDSDATDHVKPPPQEAKRKSHAPPAPSTEPQPVISQEKPVWRPVKSKSTSAIGGKAYDEDYQAKVPQEFYNMTGKTVMSYTDVISEDRKDEERRHITADIIGDHRRKTKEVVYQDADVREKPKRACNTIVYESSDDSSDDESPVWVLQDALIAECKMVEKQGACESSDDSDDVDVEHTSVDCIYSSEEDSDDEDGMYEVYVPYTKDVSNDEASETSSESCADDSNLTCISELEHSSFMSNVGNLSTASEVTVPMELGNLCYARETPPPKLTFRKRRSVSTPKNSPMLAVQTTVTPPQVDIPPIKKQRVSPSTVHLADREGPLGVVPLDSNASDLQRSLQRRSIDSVPEESFGEEASEASTEASPNQYFSAVESNASGGFYTPDESQSTSMNDDTMTALPNLTFTPESRPPPGKKRVSFSPQDHYMMPPSHKFHMPNIWARSPLKYLRRRNSSPIKSESMDFERSKPLEADHIMDSVKLARQRRLISTPELQVRNQSVQVTILPEIKCMEDAETQIEESLLGSPLKRAIDSTATFNKLPEYVPYSKKDIERMKQEALQASGDHAMNAVDKADVKDDAQKRRKVHRHTSFVEALTSAFTPKKKRKSETIVAPSKEDQVGDQCHTCDQTEKNIEEDTGKMEAICDELNSNPLNVRDDESDDPFVLEPILVPERDVNETIVTEKSATLPFSANTSRISQASLTYSVPTKFSSSDDISYLRFVQKRGRISPAIQNIMTKYKIKGGSESILEENSATSESDMKLDEESQDKQYDMQKMGGEPARIEIVDETDARPKHTVSITEALDFAVQYSDACCDDVEDVEATETNADSEKPKCEDKGSENDALSTNNTKQLDCIADPTEETDHTRQDDSHDSKMSMQEIFEDLQEMKMLIRESFAEARKESLATQKNDDSAMGNENSMERSSESSRLRKKSFTPPSSGRAMRVPIITVEEEPEVTSPVFFNNVTTTDIERNAVDMAAPRRGKRAMRESINSEMCRISDDENDAGKKKSPPKKKLGRNRSLFHKFRRKKVSKKEDLKEAKTMQGTTTTQAGSDIVEKPHKVSLFRRFSQKIRGKKSSDIAERKQLMSIDVAELCRPDSTEKYGAQKELFDNDPTPSSSTPQLPEETSTSASSDIPDKSLDTAATEADSMKVLIDKDDQLAMEGELTGNEEDWQILSHMLQNGVNKSSPSEKQSMDSIKDEYIDDELNDTMELTGDGYCSNPTSENIVSPTRVRIELQDEPNYTSTPTKRNETLSPSLEVLFSDVGVLNREPNILLCSGDHVPESPALVSQASDEGNSALHDMSEKFQYYNLTNQDLSPSIGGTGDADQMSRKSSAPTTPQVQQQTV